MIIAGTGHRPNKLGGYGDGVRFNLNRVAANYLAEQEMVTAVISGLALGWDTAIALAALDARIPLIAAVPFIGQERVWPEEPQERYRAILERASDVVIVSSGGYMPSKMQTRNIWMVDHCTRVAAFWDGSAGGTKNCIDYAQSCGKQIDNLWSRYQPYLTS